MYLSLLCLLAFLLFAFRRLKTFGQFFQQEEYDSARFFRWLIERRAFDRRVSAGVILAALVSLAAPTLALLGLTAGFLVAASLEPDATKIGKKKLVLTARARRILGLALLLIAPFAAAGESSFLALWLLPVQLIPLSLIAATFLLAPFEARVQARYWQEAQAILRDRNPRVIGIAGSFGKTSVKHILAHLLSLTYPTLATPGSVNTAMGIARVIREKLLPQHKFFLVEMGAYARGSVSRLAQLTPPTFGVITALGEEHFERFRSLDAIVAAEFELAEAVAAQGGISVTFARALSHPPARAFAEKARDRLMTVGPEATATCRILEKAATAAGVSVQVSWYGQTYDLRAPLYGDTQAENIALAFAAACLLGVPAETAAIGLASVPQIAHRLEVKRQADGITIIDDAFNSNPEGFAAALKLLDQIGREQNAQKPGRRILVTPGMVERGTRHDEEHAMLGQQAAACADVLLPVLPERISSFIEAFRTAAPTAPILPCARFADAERWMRENLRAGDVVLLENDLPDLYERPIEL